MSKGKEAYFPQKGFSLIEIIVAMVILALVVVSLAPLFEINFKQIIDSGKTSVNTYTAQENIEDIAVAGTPAGSITLSFNNGGATKKVTITGCNIYVKEDLVYLAPSP